MTSVRTLRLEHSERSQSIVSIRLHPSHMRVQQEKMRTVLHCMRWLTFMVVAGMVLAAVSPVWAQEDAEQWPKAVGPNLVANDGFEQVDKAPAPGWSAEAPVYARDISQKHGGEASLKYSNADPRKYVLAGQKVKLEPGALYDYGGWVRTENVKGDDTGAGLCLEWSDANGKYLGGSYGPGVKGTHDWTRVHTLLRVPANAAGFSLTCYVRRGMTGTAWFDDITLTKMADRPMQVVMLEPNYRGWITGDTIRARVLLNLEGNPAAASGVMQVTAEMQDADGKSLGGSLATKQDVQAGQKSCDLSLAAPPAAQAGPWKLFVRLSGPAPAREEIITSTELLQRPATKAPRVTFDQRSRTIVEGKPFFPIGFYLGGISEEDLKMLGESKVNCVMPYTAPTREQMDLAQRHNIRVIYSTKDWYFGTQWTPAWLKSEAQEETAVRQRVREMRDHPALLAWYLNDELPVAYRPRLTAHYRWTAQEDPDHPAWAVLYQVNEMERYLGTCDVIGSDPYPIGSALPGMGHASLASEWTRKTVSGMRHARPVWMVPQAFSHSAYNKSVAQRSPTAQEMRSMSWQCIAEGATGLVYYSWFDLRKSPDVPFADQWAHLREIIAEIDQMTPVILGEDSSAIRIETSRPWLHTLLRRSGDRDYAILVSDGDGEGSVQIQVPQGKTASASIGNAKLSQSGQTVQVELSKLGVAVIEVR